MKKEENVITLQIPKTIESESPPKSADKKSQLMDFYSAWKSQSSFNILLVEKLSLIVTNYFKMIPELSQRNQQIEILIMYNKALLDILNKFESQQKRLLTKLHRLEEMNIGYMRQFCIAKGREFKMPDYKPDHSIFENFRLNDLKFEKKEEVKESIQNEYRDKLVSLFQNYLLCPYSKALDQVLQKINQFSEIKQTITVKDNISDLKGLLSQIESYNSNLDQVSFSNMFDLYEIKIHIKQQLKNLDVSFQRKTQKQEQNQEMFVKNVLKIHANLEKMEENTLQKYLKQEKEIRKKFRKQRIKEQEQFERHYEKIDTENIELKTDNENLKQKVTNLEQQLSKTKIELDIRSMKQTFNNKSYSVLNESGITEGDGKSMRRNHYRDTLKARQNEVRQLKRKIEEYERKILAFDQESLQSKKNIILQKLKEENIILNKKIQLIQLAEYLANNYILLLKNRFQGKQDSIIVQSPKYQQKSVYSFHQDIHPIQEKLQAQQLEIMSEKMKQMEQERQSLFIKIDRLHEEIQEKQKIINMHTNKLEEQERLVTEKVKKMNLLAEQYEQLQREKKDLRSKNKFQQQKILLAEALSKALVQNVQNLSKLNCREQSFPSDAQKSTRKMKKYIQKYRSKLQKMKEMEGQILSELRFTQYDSFIDSDIPILKHEKDSSCLSLKSFKKKKDRSGELQQTKYVNKSNIDFKQINQQDKVNLSQVQKKPPSSNEHLRQSLKKKKNENSEDKIPIINKLTVASKNQSPNKVDSLKREQSVIESQNLFSTLKIKSQKLNEEKQMAELLTKLAKEQEQKYDETINRHSQIMERDSSENIKQKIDSSIKIQKLNKQEIKEEPSLQYKQKKVQNKLNETKKDQKKKQSKQIKKQQSIYSQKQISYQKPDLIPIQKCQKNQTLSQPPEIEIESQLSPHKRSLDDEEYLEDQKKKTLKIETKISLSNAEKFQDQKSMRLKKKYSFSHEKSSEKSKSGSRVEYSIPQIRVHQVQESLTNKAESNLIKQGQNEFEKILQNQDLQSLNKQSQISLNLSRDGATQIKRSLGIKKVQEEPHKKSAQQQDLLVVQKSRLQPKVDLQFIEHMYDKIEKLKNNPDTLDFYELYQRYKQALKCLEKQERINKMNEIKYQKFLKKVYQEGENGDYSSYDPKWQVYQLRKELIELKRQLEEEQQEYQELLSKEVRQSKQTIREHLKILSASYVAPQLGKTQRKNRLYF